MFRTRDFILIITATTFLLVAIGATILKQGQVETDSSKSVILAQVDDREHSAEVSVPESISREDRLASMRQKIAEGGKITVSAPQPAVQEEVVEAAVVAETNTVQKCAGYRESSPLWQVDGVQFEVTEGVRIVFREVIEAKTQMIGSSSVPTSETRREILAQLPVRTFKSPSSSCLPTNVVGIAQDGSLIRNDEAGLYGVFGSGTLVGYALDGYPIYGVSKVVGDKCGGQVAGGQYGYYLSDKRDSVLNCFSALPISL